MLGTAPLRRLTLALSLAAFTVLPGVALSQGATQLLLTAESKGNLSLTPASVTLQLNGKATPIQQLDLLAPDRTQVALLIDDGLRSSLGRQLTDIAQFISALKPGVEIMVGYMQNGRIVTAQAFTTNHAAAAKQVRLPFGSPGLSASPYICLSDFSKNWPRESAEYGTPEADSTVKKSRFVMMITNGVDPYNGSVSPLNQNSPYVDTASTDAQRAGIAVSSIYYPNAGIGGGAAAFSGQSYLNQIAEATGGTSYNQFRGAPPSISPYFNRFLASLDQTYIASFDGPPEKNLVSVRVKSKTRGVKLHAPQQIRVAGGAYNQ